MFVFLSYLCFSQSADKTTASGVAGEHVNNAAEGFYGKNLVNPLAYQRPGTFEIARNEKIHNVVFDNRLEGSKAIAREIASIIREKNAQGKKAVLGLATGSSPIKVYQELVRMHKEEGLSFKNVITFNLDEYYPMERENDQSYYYFMHYHLFNHIDIDEANVHIPDGRVDRAHVEEFCKQYDQMILDAGGLDFQLLGIGRTGHIGFNEPRSNINSGTRLLTLNHLTRSDAAPAFKGIKNVPKQAVTMGVHSVLGAKRIILMAWGYNKASIIKRAIEGEISTELPATYLQTHNNATIVMDTDAAVYLTRITQPWTVSDVEWTEDLKVKAIVWLAEKLHKPLLALTDDDYNNNGLAAIIADKSAYEVNNCVFAKIQSTITNTPTNGQKKKIIIFSPHPDDDVISMGGMFDRLVEQGNEVHVAYETSGNYAVADTEALRYCEVFKALGLTNDKKLDEMIHFLKTRKPTEKDSMDVRGLKTRIRKYESIGATRFLGVPDERVHHLNLPFYESGGEKKLPIGEADYKIIMDLIESVKPDLIFAAGDFADPHGTHKVCFDGVNESLHRLKNQPWMKDVTLWLYRGAWMEYDMEEIEMAIPMTQEQVMRKRKAIFFHQSQKDGAPFLGDDPREFWQRAEARNRATAERFRNLGFPEYQAIEAFRRYPF